MREALWTLVAFVVSLRPVSDLLYRTAQRQPYAPIMSPDGTTLYMWRGWLFNPYRKGPDNRTIPSRWQWLPSIRVHIIMREDIDRHLHDHPWNARTIVLRGWYVEERLSDDRPQVPSNGANGTIDGFVKQSKTFHIRDKGYTGRLLYGQFHRITKVKPGGVMTLFFTWPYRGEWGFLVDGRKVLFKDYK